MLKVGDEFTIEGLHLQVRNPDRRWWQLWKPRHVAANELQRFKVVAHHSAKV